MQHLCGVYAKWFNWKYARRGHLFGRRFGSAELVTDSHLVQAHRYVALNPVRAELCRTPESWRWGSFRALVGLDPPPDFLDVAGVHDLFATRPAKAQSMFRRFVESATRDAEPAPLARVPGA
jgi:hypothetical protein